ncbi:MAG: hypothetical protein GTN64_08115, partial [Candidatus Latescibacteria bacterium]|nr:hypothetical protein [Candidatus Latescibacterota bacterium]NIO78567.1 hypothetical protein [Candidatus Latescibacterota bacterium]
GETTSIPSAWGIDTTNVQKFAPEKPTLIARKIAGQRVISGEGVEDAIVPMLPAIRNAIIRDIASGEEKAIIDGQRTSTIDTGDAPGTNDVRYAWDGIRWYVEQYTGAKVDANGTITGTMLVSALRKAMGEYGMDDTRLVHIPSANAYLDMLGIDDVRTVGEMGPAATMVRGQLAQVGSAPIVPSRYVRTDLNASGIYDGVIETKTINILVHRGGWIIGDRRKVTIEAQRWPLDDAWQLVGMERVSFANLFGTSHNMAAVLFDITS